MPPWLAVVPAIVGVPLAAAAGTFLVLQYLDWQGGAARALSERIAFGQLTELVEFAKATAWLSILAAGISLWLIWRSAARLRASSLGTDTGQ